MNQTIALFSFFLLTGCGLSGVGLCAGCSAFSGTDAGDDRDGAMPESTSPNNTIENDGSVVDAGADSSVPDSGSVIVDAGSIDAGCTVVTHDNGLGQHWQDCVPLGTYDETQALKACAAYDAGSCAQSAGGCGAEQMVHPPGNNTLWEYQGVGAGHVSVSTCPGPSDPGWN